MESLCEYVQDNQHLEHLDISNALMDDTAVEMLSVHLIGNTNMKKLILTGNSQITDASFSNLTEIAKRTCISEIGLERTSLSRANRQKINVLLEVPIDQRELPLISNSKSAAKIISSST